MSDYFVPKTIGEAVSLLSKYKGKAKIIAGGTDLLLRIKRGEVQPNVLINIYSISELNFISYKPSEGLRIGAAATIRTIENSPVIQKNCDILAQAAGMLGSPTIRHKATIGGNICNAAPSADTAPALLVLSAKVKVTGDRDARLIPIEDFFTAPGKTMLDTGELVTEILIPTLPPHSGTAYVKHKRRHGADLAVVSVAALVTIASDVHNLGVLPPIAVTPNMRLLDAKIALGAVAPIPIRAKQPEAILKQRQIDDKLLEEACQAASDESNPIDDARSSAEYRKKMVKILTKIAITQAIAQVQLEV